MINEILLVVFYAKQSRLYQQNVDFVAVRILDTLQACGFDTNSYKLLDNDEGYMIAFYNQEVDYNVVQNAIDKELLAITKITKQNIKVELI